MARVPKAYFSVLYNGKNISEDVSKSLISINYKDKVSGESDEIEIVLEDKDLLWQNAWYPQKGDLLSVIIGIDPGGRLNCGVFQIDEIELSGPPDTISIKGLATLVHKKLRTKKSYAHENKTLSQIIHSIAAKNGFTVVGNIENIAIARSTQNRITDLSYLKKLANEYGYNFSIKNKMLVFIAQSDLETRTHSLTLDKTDLISYSFKDKTNEVYSGSKVKSHNPNTNKVINASATDDDDLSENDNLEIRTKTETESQANAKAKTQLRNKNSQQKTVSVSLPGNVLFVSGNNIDLTGFGSLTGLYHITEATHTISNSGYSCDGELKQVKSEQKASKKIPKNKPAQKTSYEVKYYVLPEYDFRKK